MKSWYWVLWICISKELHKTLKFLQHLWSPRYSGKENTLHLYLANGEGKVNDSWWSRFLSPIGLEEQGVGCSSLNSQAFVSCLIPHCCYLQVSLCVGVEGLEGSCLVKEKPLLIWCFLLFTLWLWTTHFTSFTISAKTYIHFQLLAEAVCWHAASESFLEETIYSSPMHVG